ncbi:MAG: M23 family metallopeptidase [Flavobacteriaceae bacterium]
MKTKNFFFFFLVHFILNAQFENKWVAPLEIPIQLSGTFGEFRNNHFHAGLDIRTQGREGFKVKSVQSGWVNRIRVSVSGYGKALYIEHPDGTTSVYAHLKKFGPKIESYVKEHQYQKETFQIHLFPKANEIQIEAGEVIGYSGNTGGSYGPHLHFEVRESKGQLPINPMRYPLEIKDTQRPQIQNLFLYKGIRPYKNRKELPLVRKNDSVYTTSGISTSGKINIGLRLFDRQSNSYNKNGIYSATVWLNGKKQFSYQMDRMSFDDSKYINLLIDYKEYVMNKRRIQRFIGHPSQKTSFISSEDSNGEMNIEEGKSYQLFIEVKDYENNSSYIEAYLTGVENSLISETVSKSLHLPSKDYLYQFENKSVYFPKGSFFDPVKLTVEERGDTLDLGLPYHALDKPYEIKYKIPEGDSLKIQQSFLAFLNQNNKTSFFSTSVKDGYWIGKSKMLGSYVISRDSVPPTIVPINFKEKQWLSNYSFLRFKISDDYSGLKKFRGEINGKWILLEHEPKNNSLIYDFNDLEFKEALHHLTIEAEDQVGNKTLFTADFYRKPKKNID